MRAGLKGEERACGVGIGGEMATLGEERALRASASMGALRLSWV
jgi:hypothetical protein